MSQRKILWRRKWQPTPVFSPEKSHGQRSLVGYSPCRCRVRHVLATKQQKHYKVLKVKMRYGLYVLYRYKSLIFITVLSLSVLTFSIYFDSLLPINHSSLVFLFLPLRNRIFTIKIYLFPPRHLFWHMYRV